MLEISREKNPSNKISSHVLAHSSEIRYSLIQETLKEEIIIVFIGIIYEDDDNGDYKHVLFLY